MNAEQDQHLLRDLFVDQAEIHIRRPASEPRHRLRIAVKVDKRHRPISEEPAGKSAIQEFDAGMPPVALDPPEKRVDILLFTLD